MLYQLRIRAVGILGCHKRLKQNRKRNVHFLSLFRERLLFSLYITLAGIYIQTIDVPRLDKLACWIRRAKASPVKRKMKLKMTYIYLQTFMMKKCLEYLRDRKTCLVRLWCGNVLGDVGEY